MKPIKLATTIRQFGIDPCPRPLPPKDPLSPNPDHACIFDTACPAVASFESFLNYPPLGSTQVDHCMSCSRIPRAAASWTRTAMSKFQQPVWERHKSIMTSSGMQDLGFTHLFHHCPLPCCFAFIEHWTRWVICWAAHAQPSVLQGCQHVPRASFRFLLPVRCWGNQSMILPCPAEDSDCVLQSELDADSVGNTICKRAKDMKATAIVISSQSRSKMQEFLLGSITNYCTHHCQQPVLVVQ